MMTCYQNIKRATQTETALTTDWRRLGPRESASLKNQKRTSSNNLLKLYNYKLGNDSS